MSPIGARDTSAASPTGPPRVDIHTHAIPPTLPRFGGRYAGEWPELTMTGPCTARLLVGGRHFRSLDDRCWNAQRRIEDMDRDDVALQVISPIPVTMGYGLPADGVIELSRFQNEWLAGFAQQHQRRFRAFGTVPLQTPERAAAMVEEAISFGLAGVEIGTNVSGRSLDDPALEPFFAACEATGALLFVHPWQVLGAERLRRYGLTYSVGMPTETAQAALSLVLGGVLDRHPRIEPVLAHGGGTLLALLPRVDRCWEMLPGVEQLSALPSTYVRRFYYDTLVYSGRLLDQLFSLVGPDRLLVGTDYPFAIAEQPAGAVAFDTEMTAEDRQKILIHNAEKLLRLGEGASTPEQSPAVLRG